MTECKYRAVRKSLCTTGLQTTRETQAALNKCLSVQNVDQVKEFANDSINKIGANKHA